MVSLIEIANFSPDPAIAIDDQCRILAWNSAAQDLLGYDEGDTTGHSCHTILQGLCSGDAPLCTPQCDGSLCIEREQSFKVDSCRFRCSDGSYIPVSLSALVVPASARGDAGEKAAAVLFIHRQSVANSNDRQTRLRIFTFGRFGLVIGGKGLDVDGWKRRQALTVLKCLVSDSGRPVHRERLIDHLWPDVDHERGWRRLKVTISFLRNQLRQAGLVTEAVETVDHSYLLRRDAVWTDSEVFEQLVARAERLLAKDQPELALRCCQDAKGLYRGEFMEGDPYSDWHSEKRKYFSNLHMNMLSIASNSVKKLGTHDDAGEALQSARLRNRARSEQRSAASSLDNPWLP